MSKNYLCWKKVGLLNTPLMNIMKWESSVHMQDNIQFTSIYWEICTVSSLWVILVYICIIQVTASLTGLRPIYHYESGQVHIKLTY